MGLGTSEIYVDFRAGRELDFTGNTAITYINSMVAPSPRVLMSRWATLHKSLLLTALSV